MLQVTILLLMLSPRLLNCLNQHFSTLLFQDAQLNAEERYSSLADEIDSKTKKLKRAIAKYQGAKAEVEQAHREMQELNEEFQREREDLLDSIRALDQQLRLKNLIIEVGILFYFVISDFFLLISL
jgi:peptidoglycan hydrolase CwlO-like protein